MAKLAKDIWNQHLPSRNTVAPSPRLLACRWMHHTQQFGIYEFVRKELMSRKDEQHKPRNWLPPAVRETLRIGVDRGSVQHDYFKDFLRNVYLMEEELM